MISRRRFLKLRRGDVVLFGPRLRPRMVQEGPADRVKNWTKSVTFAKLRNSRYHNPATCYGYNDVKDKLSVPKRRPPNVWRDNLATLLELGFDVRDIAEAVAEHKRVQRVLPRLKCGRVPSVDAVLSGRRK